MHKCLRNKACESQLVFVQIQLILPHQVVTTVVIFPAWSVIKALKFNVKHLTSYIQYKVGRESFSYNVSIHIIV